MKQPMKLAGVLTLGTLLAACGSDDETTSNETDKNNDAQYTIVTGIDASSAFAYFDLDTNTQLELTDEEAQTNLEWDMAFKSTNIILNGDYSGPGNVTAAYAGNNADFRDEEGEPIAEKFIAATPESELSDFTDITQYPADVEFKGDIFKTVFDSSFYAYNHLTHEVTANDSQYFLFSNEDGYYKIRVTSASNDNGGSPGSALTEFTIGYQFKAQDDQTFSSEETYQIAQCDGQHYVDFSQNSEVAATESWDISVLCNDFEVHLGDDAQAYALTGSETDEDLTNIMSHPQYYLTADYANTVFKHQYKWYDYNLEGNSKIWSQYRVYFVKTPIATYKLQVTGYYNQVDGEVKSRQISFIYDEIEQASAE